MRSTQTLEPAHVRVAAHLREMILASPTRPGMALPTETALCKKFKVSRSTVREALRSLASEHLIATRRGVGGGNTIAHVDHPDVRRMLGSAFTMLSRSDTVTVAELLEARELLEVPAAGIAAVRRSAEHLAQMRSLTVIDTSQMTARDLYRANSSFHESILEATTNRLVRTMTEPVFSTLQDRFARELATRSFWRTVLDDHKVILEAIESCDSRAASESMAAHLRRLRATYEELDRLASARRTLRRRRSGPPTVRSRGRH